jgi:hypothetical protein
MRIFDAIMMGITVGVARLLRGLLKSYNRLLASFKAKPLTPLEKCNKLVKLRNNSLDIRLRGLSSSLPSTEGAPQRRIVQ